MPALRSALTMASASSTLSSTIIRRSAVSGPFAIQLSVLDVFYTMAATASNRTTSLRVREGQLVNAPLAGIAGDFAHQSRHEVA